MYVYVIITSLYSLSLSLSRASCAREGQGMVDGLWLVGVRLMDGVLVAIGLHGLLTWAGLAYGLWMLDQRVAFAIDDLDGNIAEAIQAVIKGAQDIEPINPIQQAIAGYLQQQFAPPTITAQVRDVSGKYSDEENNKPQ